MPSLMLRRLSPALIAEIKAYARDYNLSPRDACVELLTAGLRAHDAAVARGDARAKALTPTRRAEIATQAARARWGE